MAEPESPILRTRRIGNAMFDEIGRPRGGGLGRGAVIDMAIICAEMVEIWREIGWSENVDVERADRILTAARRLVPIVLAMESFVSPADWTDKPEHIFKDTNPRDVIRMVGDAAEALDAEMNDRFWAAVRQIFRLHEAEIGAIRAEQAARSAARPTPKEET
jgi:hypothetical protein